MLFSLYRVHRSYHTFIMVLGALSWAIGNLLWIISSYIPVAIPWWGGFLLLTITAERLELRKLVPLPLLGRLSFHLLTLTFIFGLIMVLLFTIPGLYLIGLSAFGFAIWLLKFDTSRNFLFQGGLTRFIAISLLLGYIWLGVSGILTILYRNVHAGIQYDAILHAFFLGFVFSMIFGHAPIILPSVMNIRIGFSNRFYAHLILLHISVLLRIIGDLAY